MNEPHQKVLNIQPWSQLLILIIVGLFNPIWMTYQSSKLAERQFDLNQVTWTNQKEYEVWLKWNEQRFSVMTALDNAILEANIAINQFNRTNFKAQAVLLADEDPKVTITDRQEVLSHLNQRYDEVIQRLSALSNRIHQATYYFPVDPSLITRYEQSSKFGGKISPEARNAIRKLITPKISEIDRVCALSALEEKYASGDNDKAFFKSTRAIMESIWKDFDLSKRSAPFETK